MNFCVLECEQEKVTWWVYSCYQFVEQQKRRCISWRIKDQTPAEVQNEDDLKILLNSKCKVGKKNTQQEKLVLES